MKSIQGVKQLGQWWFHLLREKTDWGQKKNQEFWCDLVNFETSKGGCQKSIKKSRTMLSNIGTCGSLNLNTIKNSLPQLYEPHFKWPSSHRGSYSMEQHGYYMVSLANSDMLSQKAKTDVKGILTHIKDPTVGIKGKCSTKVGHSWVKPYALSLSYEFAFIRCLEGYQLCKVILYVSKNYKFIPELQRLKISGLKCWHFAPLYKGFCPREWHTPKGWTGLL